MRSIHIDNEELFSVIDYAEEVGVESGMFEEYLLNGPEDYFLFLATLGKYQVIRYTHNGYDKSIGAPNVIIEDFYSNILLLRNYEVWCHKVGYVL